MVQPAFLIFEALTILLFAACLWHAARQEGAKVLELFSMLGYGIFLEWMTLRQLDAYQYGHFWVMLDDTPVCIGLGWAVIIYTGMEFVRSIRIPDFARPFLVGYLALHLDLAIDVIAIRLGFWHWAIPLNSQWFGVPWANFWAWYIVVTSFSGLLYYLRRQGWHVSRRGWQRWSYPGLALLGSVVILALANLTFAGVFAQTGLLGAMSMILLLLPGGIGLYVTRPQRIPARPVDWVLFAVPLSFHLFFNAYGFLGGYYQQTPVLAVAGLAMLALGLGLHLWPGKNLQDRIVQNYSRIARRMQHAQ
jgi:hypothetical protein